MAHLLSETSLLGEHVRLEDALEAFWQDFVYRPSKQTTPGRQYMRGVLDELPVWTTNDDDHHRARVWSPAVFLGAFDDEHLVELPALWAAVPAPAADVAASAEELLEQLDELELPAPHYLLYGDETLYPIWRIEPLRRPSKKAPLSHYAAFRQCLLAWHMARTKLALALGEKLEPRSSSSVAELIPLPHPAHRSTYLDSDAYLVDANPEAPTLRIRAISEPLGPVHDAAAWKRVRPHENPLPRYLRPREAWVTSPAFLEASKPKKKGERHPAALTITCVLRWAGWAHEAIVDYLGRWHERNLEKHEFPDRRPSSDEIKDLVDWAFKKLTPGGPDRRPAEDRGRYTARHAAIAAVLSFLTAEEAHLSPWYGTQADLAAAATAWAAQRGHTLTVTRDSLQKLLRELQEEHGLLRVIEREGRTWITRWALRAAYTADAPEPPEKPGRAEAEGQVIPLHDLPSDPGSERQMPMSIRRPQVDPPNPPEGRGELNPEKQVKPVLSEVPPPAPSPSTSLRNPPGFDDLNPSTQHRSYHHDPPSSRKRPKMPRRAVTSRELLETLVGLGFSVLPLRPASKMPFGSSWGRARQRRATLEELEASLDACPTANLAIVTGELSDLVVVDLDSEEALRWAAQHLPPTPLRVVTGRGQHWYFRHPGDGAPVPNRGCLRGLAIDVKADGGYVVAPGSKHPDGHRYAATAAWTPELLAETPRFQRRWLLDEQEAETPQRLDGEDDRAFGIRQLRAIREALKRGDWRVLRKRGD